MSSCAAVPPYLGVVFPSPVLVCRIKDIVRLFNPDYAGCKISRELRDCGATESGIFPDIDSLARRIFKYYSRH